MNQLAKVENAPRRAIIEVQDPIPLLDTAQFEHMQRIAKVMAQSTLIPEALYMEGTKDKKELLPYEQILSNCFLVVNQAVRWGMDPFAVAQCVSVVHGKLCYEGKLVSAVLDAKLHVRLHHHFTGEGEATRIYLSDRQFDAETISELKPGFRKAGWRLFDGSVAEWKTSGNGTPWTPKNFVRMLIYRGTRDWTRIYEPAIMLGVYTPDEMLDLSENVRALRAHDVADRPSLADRLSAARAEPQEAPQTREGFDPSFVTRETAALTGEADSTQTEDNSQSSDTPSPSHEGSDGEAMSPGQGTVAADLSPDDESGKEEGDNTGQVTTEQAAPSSTYSRADCVKAFMQTATDAALTAPERRELLAQMKEWWKDALSDDLPFVKDCLSTADKVAKGELLEAAARKYLDAIPAPKGGA